MPLRLTSPLVPEALSATVTDDLGLARDTGIMLAFIPTQDGIPREVTYREGTRTYILAHLDGVVLDLIPQDMKPVKWWIVKNAAREEKLNIPQPLWYGPAEDLNIDELPDLPQPENTVLAMRQYSQGPWIKLQNTKKMEEAPIV